MECRMIWQEKRMYDAGGEVDDVFTIIKKYEV